LILRYSVVRFTPNPIREESVNIGLIRKVRAVGGIGAVAYARALVKDLESEVDMDGRQSRLFPPASERLTELFERLPRRFEGYVRFSDPLAAVADDPDDVFDHLYRQLIGYFRAEAAKIPPKVIASREDLKDAFRHRARSEWEIPAVEEGVQGSVRHPVDFGVFGDRLVFVVHTVSFRGDLAWATYQRAILSEAAIDIGKSGNGVSFGMLYLPADLEQEEAAELQRASTDFAQGLGILPVPIDEIDTLGTRIREALPAQPLPH
jgi:hypothetical protein